MQNLPVKYITIILFLILQDIKLQLIAVVTWISEVEDVMEISYVFLDLNQILGALFFWSKEAYNKFLMLLAALIVLSFPHTFNM